MPLPLLIGGAAALAGIVGVGSGISGGVKMKEAKDSMDDAKNLYNYSIKKFKEKDADTTKCMDGLGKYEMEILKSFQSFADLIEKIQGRPDFKKISVEGIELPEYKAEELKKVSAGAGVLLGGLGGAAAGTAGGFAAAGATTSAVMAFGAASTGTAIADLSGIAASNAALAALGGGALSAGGGGMALGAAVLGGATLGVGLLVGGVIFNVTGSKLSDKADEALEQAHETEKEVNSICKYLDELRWVSQEYEKTLKVVNAAYQRRVKALDFIVNFSEKTKWSEFTEKEKNTTENAVLLVGLLFKMCQISLVCVEKDKEGRNKINRQEAEQVMNDANAFVYSKLNEDAV